MTILKLEKYLQDNGYEAPEIPQEELDEVRFPSQGKGASNKSAGLKHVGDGIVFKDFALDITMFFPLTDEPVDMSPEAIEARLAKARAKTKRQQAYFDEHAAHAKKVFNQSSATMPHLYLTRKQIGTAAETFDTRVNLALRALVIPMYNAEMDLRNLEMVYADPNTSTSSKARLSPITKGMSGEVHGLMHFHNTPRHDSIFFVVEGWATGWSAQQMIDFNISTHHFCVVSAFSAGNIPKVVAGLKNTRGDAVRIILGLDNDESSEKATKHLTENKIKPMTHNDWDDLRKDGSGNEKANQLINPLRRVLELFKPIATLYYTDLAVGSGKTTTMVNTVMLDPTKVYLYVAPTNILIDQTHGNLQERLPEGFALEKVTSQRSKDGVEENPYIVGKVWESVNARLEHHAANGTGAVVFCTHASIPKVAKFLASHVKKKVNVFFDESAEAAKITRISLGTGGASTRGEIRKWQDLLTIGKDGSVEPTASARETFNPEIKWDDRGSSKQDLRQEFSTHMLEEFTLATARMSPRLQRYWDNDGVYPRIDGEDRGAAEFSSNDPDYGKALYLDVGVYLDPRIFKGFETIVLMAANFDTLPLGKLWKNLNVDLVRDPRFDDVLDNNVRAGKRVTIRYVTELSGKDYRNAKTNIGTTIMANALRNIAKMFEGRQWAVQLNNAYREEDKETGENLFKSVQEEYPDLFEHAIPMKSQGSNAYKHIDNVAILGIVNPSPSDASWYEFMLKMNAVDVRKTNRFDWVYQGFGRCSMRDHSSTRPINVVVWTKEDAEQLHKILPGSILAGEVPQVLSLKRAGEHEPHADAEWKKHVESARNVLNGVAGDKISSRILKEHLSEIHAEFTTTQMQKLTKRLKEEPFLGWKLEGQSWIRASE